MMRLESIALRDCKVYRDWKNAPDGAILQIRTVSMRIPIIVLKCQIIGPQGNYLPCIVHLEGNQFAHCISLRDAGALDVSGHFDDSSLIIMDHPTFLRLPVFRVS